MSLMLEKARQVAAKHELPIEVADPRQPLIRELIAAGYCVLKPGFAGPTCEYVGDVMLCWTDAGRAAIQLEIALRNILETATAKDARRGARGVFGDTEAFWEPYTEVENHLLEAGLRALPNSKEIQDALASLEKRRPI